jgi:hypothetical protein
MPPSPQGSQLQVTGTFSYGGALLYLGNGTDGEAATAGSITASLNQADDGGGVIGSYDLTFGSDVERGTFVAPTCDICAVGP